MRSMVRYLLTLPNVPGPLRVAAFVLAGAAVGLAIVTGRISNATSYLSEAPRTCMNCHVMTDAYASWQRGSHARVAVCTDCHVPHSNPVAKVAFKGADGLKHATVFTLRIEPQVLRLSRRAVPVVQANCLRCHAGQVAMSRLAGPDERACWDCHNNIHGSVRSLSASPRELRPRLGRAGLNWMTKETRP